MGPVPISPRKRFLNFVDKNGPKQPHMRSRCWMWKGHVLPNGYGQFNDGTKVLLAHRAAHEIFIGPIPDGLDVCHECDVRACVRWDGHLVPGTRKKNMQDAKRRGRIMPRKLSDAQVAEIVQRYDGSTSYAKLATEYGVSPALVAQIITGRARKTS